MRSPCDADVSVLLSQLAIADSYETYQANAAAYNAAMAAMSNTPWAAAELSMLYAAAGLGLGQPTATHLAVSVPSNVIAGVPFLVTVEAEDAQGNIDSGFQGHVEIGSSEPNAAIDPSYTFTSADGGVHSFLLTMTTS